MDNLDTIRPVNPPLATTPLKQDINMSTSQESPEVKTAPALHRPGMVTLFAFLIAISAIPMGCAAGGVPLYLGANRAVSLVLLLILCPLVTGFYGVVAWGLWNLKNWSRYGLTAIIIFAFLLNLITVVNDDNFTKDPGFTVMALLLFVAIRAAVIYWFLNNGKYFQGGGTLKLSRSEIKSIDIRNRQMIRMIVVSSLVGVITIVCLTMGYIIVTGLGK